VSAKKGNDNNDGSLNAPVATVERAKEIVNNAKEGVDTDVYVVLEEGNYFITEPINFTQEDSGVNDNKIIYQGNTYGSTVINGGIEVTDYTLDNQLLTATLEVEDVRQLYVNGEPAKISESDKISANALYNPVYNDSGNITSAEGIIVATDSLPESFFDETSAELVYYNEWKKSRFPIVKIKKLDNNETALILGEAFAYFSSSSLSSIAQCDLYLENCVCYTDESGEFTFDRKTKTITYYKNSEETINSLYIPVSEGFINICGTKSESVKNLVFENITFENGAWNYPTQKGLYIGQADRYYTANGQQSHLEDGELIAGQIELNWCENIEFKNNTVKNSGSVAFTLTQGVKNCVISGNNIYDTAAGGVRVGSHKHFSDAALSKMCVGNTIVNNTITDISLQYSTSPAVTVFYAKDTTITKNTIRNTPYSGISVGWGWGSWDAKFCANNEISFNRIENVMTTLRDGAHIYTNGKQTNTQIFNNYMIKSSEPTSGDRGHYGGIYLDNGSSNITAYNNVIEECDRWMCAPHGHITDRETGKEKDSYFNIELKNNYSDTENYSINSQSTDVITVSNTGSNTSAEAEAIKATAGVQ